MAEPNIVVNLSIEIGGTAVGNKRTSCVGLPRCAAQLWQKYMWRVSSLLTYCLTHSLHGSRGLLQKL